MHKERHQKKKKISVNKNRHEQNKEHNQWRRRKKLELNRENTSGKDRNLLNITRWVGTLAFFRKLRSARKLLRTGDKRAVWKRIYRNPCSWNCWKHLSNGRTRRRESLLKWLALKMVAFFCFCFCLVYSKFISFGQIASQRWGQYSVCKKWK